VAISDLIGQDPGAIGPGVLTIVSTLVDELGGWPGGRPIGLDDRLDRDLGIGRGRRLARHGAPARPHTRGDQPPVR